MHAANGEEGMRKLRKMTAAGAGPCLIILDINMPVKNGKETLQEIKQDERLKAIPVIMFSTSNNPADKQFAESLGAGFITKPIVYLDIKKLVEEFVLRCKLNEGDH